MIAKTILGKTFKGAVNYIMKKEGAEVLDSQWVRTESPKLAIEDFDRVRAIHPKLSKPVYHMPIAFAYPDQVDNELMVKIARDFIDMLGLSSTQYLVVRHHDTKHEHIHVLANRIQPDGKVISDRFSKNRAARVSNELEVKYNLIIARDQKRQWLTSDVVPELKKVKQEIHMAVLECIEIGAKNLAQFNLALADRGVVMKLQRQTTGRVNGISFSKGKYSFKGSAVDKSLSYGRLMKQLNLDPQPFEKVRQKQESQQPANTVTNVLQNITNGLDQDAKKSEAEIDKKYNTNQGMSL